MSYATQANLGGLSRLASFVLVISFVSGCASSYEETALKPPTSKLTSGASILIATPTNGFYETKEYKGSGDSTARAVRAAFARYSNDVNISAECVNLDCLRGSQSTAVNYYVVPEILHWEDRNTEWSGIPDWIEIKLAVYDAEDGAELATAVVRGKWATFGGDHPQDLSPEPINAYVDSLYCVRAGS